jgi:hypothetical protein
MSRGSRIMKNARCFSGLEIVVKRLYEMKSEEATRPGGMASG